MFLTFRRSGLSSFCFQLSQSNLSNGGFYSYINKLPVLAIKPFSPLQSFFLNSSLPMCVSTFIQFVQETFVHSTYVPFWLPSVGLSAVHRKFLCTWRTYHGHLTILGLARACPNNRCLFHLAWKSLKGTPFHLPKYINCCSHHGLRNFCKNKLPLLLCLVHNML